MTDCLNCCTYRV